MKSIILGQLDKSAQVVAAVLKGGITQEGWTDVFSANAKRGMTKQGISGAEPLTDGIRYGEPPVVRS